MHAYEVRLRKDHRGVDLISDVLHLIGCGWRAKGTQQRSRLREAF
jgi:hypothetical protein